jgi:hypothetical protein
MKNKFSISAKAKNLFLSLAESIAQTLNVTSSYVCGRPTWETTGLGKKMTNGLLSKPSSTWSCHLGKDSLGDIAPLYIHTYIYVIRI